MIRRHLFMGVTAAAIALSGCGGGSDPSPTPSPSPTGSPSPSPTASPTYAALPLTAAQEFITLNAATSYTGDLAGTITLGAAGTELRSDRVRLALSNSTSTGTFVVREAAEESRFDSADLVTPPAPSTTEFVFRENGTTGAFTQLEILNNIIPSQVTTDPVLARTRVGYANWYRGTSTTGQKRLTYTVFGYPTYVTDLPTGTVSYTAKVSGRVVGATPAGTGGVVDKLTGTATVSANLTTGLVTVTLTLNRINSTTAAVTTFGTVTGQGALPTGTNMFTGSFGAGLLPGTFAGGFYGSAGAEIGIAFSMIGTDAATGREQRVVGVLVGPKS